MSWLLALAALAALVGGLEPLLRRLVAGRIRALLTAVVEVEDPTVLLPPGRLAPGLLRGRLAAVDLTTPCLHLEGLAIRDVTVRLVAIRLDRHLAVVAGEGRLVGHLSGDDVRRRTGMPGRVRLEGGRAAVRLGTATVGVRPVVDGDRIRLTPTPFAMALPPLPPGVRLVAVDTAGDALHLRATVQLPLLLSGQATR